VSVYFLVIYTELLLFKTVGRDAHIIGINLQIRVQSVLEENVVIQILNCIESSWFASWDSALIFLISDAGSLTTIK
jgi:hypothetical protein